MVGEGGTPTRTRPLPVALILGGCAAFAAATFVPVMKWSVNEYHETAGNARVWFGDDWTLADGGFEGAWLLPVATAAIVLLAAAALVGRGTTLWRAQVGLAALVGYIPAWTAVAFVRKLEDDVDVDVGLALLAIASLLVIAGLWLGRPTGTDAGAAPSSPISTDHSSGPDAVSGHRP